MKQYFLMTMLLICAVNADSVRESNETEPYVLSSSREHRRALQEKNRPSVFRFATYKPVASIKPTLSYQERVNEEFGTNGTFNKNVTYIDILNERKVYDEVKRSRTNEVNSVWSPTFLAFFGVELVLIGTFVIFGLLMFVLLQCKPKKYEKHVTLFD